MKRKLAIVGVVAAVLFGSGSFLLYRFTRPMYQPGQVRSGAKLDAPLDPPAQIEAGFFQVTNGIRLRRFESGSGRLALVVHGGPGFPPTGSYPGLDLVDGFRFVYYHQRGCGESTRPFDRLEGGTFEKLEALEGSLGLGAQIGDIERIRRILGEEKLVIVGHSFGALIASLYAAEFPERVAALVLVAPATMVKAPGEHADLIATIRERLPETRRSAFDDWLDRYRNWGGLLERSEAELAALAREIGPFWREAVAANGVTMAAEEMAIDNNGGWMPFATFLSTGLRHDYSPALRAVAAPVLVAHGEKDLQSEAASREYVGYFPSAEFAVVAGAGHFPFFETPQELAAVVARFLAGFATH
jgi:proline iminopeptidase